MIGFAMCGSFCCFASAYAALEDMHARYGDIQPIMSNNAYITDTRFGRAEKWKTDIENICRNKIIHTILDAEPLGPSRPLDALVICPCTGNTLAKIANGITDTPVCMAAKAHLRCDRPLVIALASNDAMSANLANIAKLLVRKNVYFVPMLQDSPEKKPHSLVADFSMTAETLDAALSGRQIRKLFL